MTEEDRSEIDEIVRLAGIKATEKVDLVKVGEVDLFDAGSASQMRTILDRYKSATGDFTPSHVFKFGDQIFVATRVVADPTK